MNQFLSQYMRSLSTLQQAQVKDVLGSLIVSKNNLDSVADQLTGQGQFYPLTVNPEVPNSKIVTGDIVKKFQDVAILMSAMYTTADLISTLLDTHSKSLSADIKAIEDELSSAQKLLNNYAFLMADGATYGYSYIETFANSLGQDTLSFPIPDRAAQTLVNPAIIATNESCLSLSQELVLGASLVANLMKSNASSFVVEDTGIVNCISNHSTKGWQLTIQSPATITYSFPEAHGAIGAQIMVEFTLSQPAPCTHIKVTPLADQPFDLIQAILYSSDSDNIGVNVLDAPKSIELPTTIFFPAQTVSKFTFLINQPTYKRVTGPSNSGEESYRQIYNAVQQRNDDGFNIINDTRFLNLIKKIRIYLNSTQFGAVSPQVEIPYGSYNPSYGPLDLEKNLVDINNRNFYNSWEVIDEEEAQLLNIFTQIFPDWQQLFTQWGRQHGDIDRALSTQSASSDGSQTVTVTPVPPAYQYQYEIGLLNVLIGYDAPAYNGYFISTPLQSAGSIGEIKLKVDDENYQLPNTDRVSRWVTSTEYSISNISNPSNESDWMPILPVGLSTVTAERLFPDISGKCIVRFPIDTSRGINVYRDGYPITNFHSFNDPSTGTAVGFIINDPIYTSAFYTCDYAPLGDPSVISISYTNIPLVSAYDRNGAGEGFTTTGNRNSVQLSFIPYIDQVQVANSQYYSGIGLYPYQPVRVIFSDGTTAINITDYTGATSPSLTQTSGYYFIQSGNNIIFNIPVTQPFRVYYQYPQSNIRIRAVLRVNYLNYVSPKINSIHVKGKVIQPTGS